MRCSCDEAVESGGMHVDGAGVEDLNSQVRRIAILVTSLDAAAGRQLLMAMPSQLARDVRRAMTRLGSIDPEEQRQILAEFRLQALSAEPAYAASNTDGRVPETDERPEVAMVASVSESEMLRDGRHSRTSAVSDEFETHQSKRPWQRLDTTALTRLLRGERATVIAVVLSQLEPRPAAAVLEQLPRQHHREVITALASLGQIDPDAMAAIDEYLASRIADYQHRETAESETVGRLQQLLSAAPDTLRGEWQSILRESEPQLADRMGLPVQAVVAADDSDPAVDPSMAEPAMPLAASTSRPKPAERAARISPARPGTSLIDLLANNVVTTADSQMPAHSQDQADDEPRVLPFPGVPATPQSIKPMAQRPAHNKPAHTNPANDNPANDNSVHTNGDRRAQSPLARFEHLLDLPAAMIGQILAQADTDVVLLALAGASPAFMQRFTAMLERQDARALKARIRELGPIHLQDVDEAQRRLCNLAIRVVEQAEEDQQLQFATTKAA